MGFYDMFMYLYVSIENEVNIFLDVCEVAG